ncbi:MAG: ABC transporter substrate-binding protein [Clostridia bacterium]
MLDFEVGTYGGTLRTVTAVINWDADTYVMNVEPLINSPAYLGKEFTGNILKAYEVSEDQKEYTFYLREGLKWSDGQPVTMEDFRFAFEDVIMNEDLIRQGTDCPISIKSRVPWYRIWKWSP